MKWLRFNPCWETCVVADRIIGVPACGMHQDTIQIFPHVVASMKSLELMHERAFLEKLGVDPDGGT